MMPDRDRGMTPREPMDGQGPCFAGGPTTRFAPSPTGRLHLGHAFSAMLAHDLARARGGRFLLRIEDIDGTRSRPEHVAGILEDLAWLGLAWDGPMVRQSTRLDAYADALESLRKRGLVYPCYCSRADIAAATGAPHGPTAVYPGTCRGAAVDLSRPHAWRIDMARAVALAGPLAFDDAWHGRIVADPLAQGDVVLARKDAPASYHLAATIDDGWSGVTDVVRGDDLLAATDVHRLLQALLGLPTPHYHHHPLLAGPDGRRLAKRDGAPSLKALRDGGADPVALVADLRGRALATDGKPPISRA
jgi:glutamyl-Q tRNA(Asp) synthetase